MADKLDWLNKHFVLLRYLSLAEAVEKENYKLRPDLAELYAGVNGVEEMAYKFAKHEKFKDACELLAYVVHRRAGVWWLYRCVNALGDELKENPAVDRDIADIGTNFTPTVPDFAKIKPPEVDPALKAQAEAALAGARAKTKAARANADPEMLALLEQAVEVAFQQFKKVHGIHPIDLLKKVGARLHEDRNEVDPNSPIFKAADELKAKLQAVQKETVDTIKSVIPPKVPEHEKKLRDNALAAVYRWVAAPDAENSQKCLDIGNECPDTPAGLLSLSAFWAYGNLMPMGEQTVPTPPGLAANGLSQVLLMCALHKGGTRKLKERYELYFNLGVEVLTGKDIWEESLGDRVAPHEKPVSPVESGSSEKKNPMNGNTGYKRWKDESLSTEKPIYEKPVPPPERTSAEKKSDVVPPGGDTVQGEVPKLTPNTGYKRWKPE
ncbi:MAG: hypothetical protein LBT13_07245 [Treponema sp.]|jgi:hypothetical protein|nr:hypothetical protein [Treponema sp.]